MNIIKTVIFVFAVGLVSLGLTFLFKNNKNVDNTVETAISVENSNKTINDSDDSDYDESDDDFSDESTIKIETTNKITNSNSQKTYTLSEVSSHKDSSDCWSAVNGYVYDITSFINKHPGGDRNILKICGIDGSSAFNGQHGGQSKPENILASFKIGVLAK